MSQRRHVAIIAGVAALLAATPLLSIFQSWSWFLVSAVMIALLAGSAIGARALRAPLWAQVLAMFAVQVLFLTVRFGDGHAFFGMIPTAETITHFQALLNDAGTQIQSQAAPVPRNEGLEFLALLGVSCVALLIDVLAVGLRRPALAGLPMLAIYSVPIAVLDNPPPIPFILVTIGYLWLLVADNTDRVRRWGRRFSGDGKDVDTWEPSPLAAAGRRLAFFGLVVAVVVPLLIPGMTSGWIDKFGVNADGEGPGSGNGSSSVVDPFTHLRGNLSRDKAFTMGTVVTDEPQPGYIRMSVADDATEDAFKPRPVRDSVTLAKPHDAAAGVPATVGRRNYTASFDINNLKVAYVPMYARPNVVDAPKVKNGQYDPYSDIGYLRNGSVNGQKYTETYTKLDFTVDELRAAAPVGVNTEMYQLDTAVPPRAFVKSEVEKTVKGLTNQYDKVMALMNYFSTENGFRYNLSTQEGTSGSAIQDFLTNKVGYCEQYASAMAWMTREAKIPARVVIGFTQGTRDARDFKKWTLTNFNLHAWVEVYFTGYGWVPFDPTPSGSVRGSVQMPWAPAPGSVVPTTAPSAGAVPSGGAEPSAPKPGAGKPGEDAGTSGTVAAPAQWPWYVAGAALLLVFLLAPAATRRLIRRHRLAADLGDARQRAHAAWAEFGDLLTDYQMSSEAVETPRGLAARLTGRHVGKREFPGLLSGGAADGIRALSRAEETARYSAHDPVALEALPGALAAVRAGLRSDAGRWLRIRAELFPSSTLESWRTGLASAGYATVEWIGRAQRALAPRRLLRRS